MLEMLYLKNVCKPHSWAYSALYYWLGKTGSSRTSLLGLNILAGNQCPGRPDPSCCVPWPAYFSRALHLAPQELDGEEERQWRGPGTSRWRKTWLGHLAAPPILRGHKVVSSQKGRQALSHWPISLPSTQGFEEHSVLCRIKTNVHRLGHSATQEGNTFFHWHLSFQQLTCLQLGSCLPPSTWFWGREREEFEFPHFWENVLLVFNDPGQSKFCF